MKREFLEVASFLCLRIGIAIAFLWFGFSQLKDPSMWTGMLPSYVTNIVPLQPTTLIYISGAAEVVLSLLLLLGLYTRTAAFLLALHLAHITTLVGYGPIGIRDIALTLTTLSIALRGPDSFCLDYLLKETQERPIKK